MSESTGKRARSSKQGTREYRRSTGSMRALRNAMTAGRALRMAPAAAVQVATVQRAETAIAMKNAGFVDTDSSVYSFRTTSTVLKHIGIVPQGASVSSRVGGKIKWKSIQIRGWVEPGGSQAIPVVASFLVIYDRYPNGGLPSAGDILSVVSAGGMLNDGNRQRFVIVRRLDYVVGPKTGLAAAEPSVMNSVYFVDEYIKLRGLMATYIGTGTSNGQIADMRTGALYVLPVGSTDTSGEVPVATLTIRTRFADLQG